MFVSDEEFVQLKNRYKEYEACDFPNCDDKMIPVLQKINSLDGVVSVFCCQGHYYNPPDPEVAGSRTYLLLGITEDGFSSLKKVFDHLKERLNLLGSLEITFQQSVWPIGEVIKNFADFMAARQYSSCNLSYAIPGMSEAMFENYRDSFLNTLCDCIDYVNQ